MTLLHSNNLSIGYKNHPAILERLGLELHPKKLTCLLGPNGAGKSTLMRTLAGMQTPLAGQVFVGDTNLHKLKPRERATRLSIVLTERPNLGMLNGYALVALGRYPYTNWVGKLNADDARIVHWAIEAVGAKDIADYPFMELSDGQKQKLLVARALAQESDIILLDEPTAFLDLPRRVEIMRLLRDLAQDTGRAILLSSHDLDLAIRSADTLWLIEKQPTKSQIHVGTPEDLVLAGTFQQAFASDGIDFDMELGAFKITQTSQQKVQLEGNGLAYLWSKRALERVGYQLSTETSTRISISNDPIRWQLQSTTHKSEHHNLASLLSRLESIAPVNTATLR